MPFPKGPITERQPNWKKIRHQYETQDISLRVLAHRWGFKSKNSIVRRMEADRGAGDPWQRDEQMIAARLATDAVLAMEDDANKRPIERRTRTGKGTKPKPLGDAVERPPMPVKSGRKPGRPKKERVEDPSNIAPKDKRKGPINNKDLRAQVDPKIEGHRRDHLNPTSTPYPEPKPENTLHGVLAMERNPIKDKETQKTTVIDGNDSEVKRYKKADSDVNEGSSELRSARKIANAQARQIKAELDGADLMMEVATVVLTSVNLSLRAEQVDGVPVTDSPVIAALRRFNAFSVKDESLTGIVKTMGYLMEKGANLKRRALGMTVVKGDKGGLSLPAPEGIMPQEVKRLMGGLELSTLKDLSRVAGEAQKARREAQVAASQRAAEEGNVIDEDGREV